MIYLDVNYFEFEFDVIKEKFSKAFAKCVKDVIKTKKGSFYMTDAFRDDPLLCCSGSCLCDLPNAIVLTRMEFDRLNEFDKPCIIFCPLIHKGKNITISHEVLPLTNFIGYKVEQTCDVMFVDMPFQAMRDVVYSFMPIAVLNLVKEE